MAAKLTQSAQKKITKDWNREFATLAIYKPMWLLKRNGPLLFGICLNRDSGNEEYTPTFHVHNLARTFPSITLSLDRPLLSKRHNSTDFIQVRFHDNDFPNAVRRFKEQNPLLDRKDVGFLAISNFYREQIAQRLRQFPCNELADLALVAAAIGLKTRSTRIVDDAVSCMRTWPTHIIERIGGVEEWRVNISNECSDVGRLKMIVQSQIREHDLVDIPSFELVSDIA